MKRLIILALIPLAACLKTRGELAENEEKKVVQTQVQNLQKQKADADAQVMNLETQLRTQNGRIESLEHENQIIAKAHDEQAQKVVALEGKVKALEDGILQVGQEIDALKAAPVKKASEEKKTGEDKKSGPFEAGEDYFNQKEWKKAISSYRTFLEGNPKGENAAMATYKIGASLAELKMPKEAKVFLEETVEKYPKSKAARQATFRLGQMKKKQ